MKHAGYKNSLPIKSSLFFFFCVFIALRADLCAQSDFNVLDDWLRYSDAENSLYHHMTDQAFHMLEKRSVEITSLHTPQDWRQRQQSVRETLLRTAGLFPAKTSLNPRITSRVEKQHYQLQNLIFESMPGFFVTATLFIPKPVDQKRPAILFCSGHSSAAYRRPYYQLPLLNLVKKGFIVLAIDPLGQGERLQYFDPEIGKSRIGSSTQEHSYPSPQVFLCGQSVARYFIWDGVRAIDYLVSRKEVDASRIGCHGLSGGGTQTAYIAALDDRVAAAAPAGYITSYRRLMESVGVQDGEQNFFHGIASGIDHGDLIEIRAPKPTLIVATSRDFFSIEGTRETYAEAQRAYRAFGKVENLQLVEDDHGHGYTRKNREAIYAFFQKHLDLPGSATEEEVEYLTPVELQKTESGQVNSSLQGTTVFDMNRKEAEKLINTLEQRRSQSLSSHLESVVSSANTLSGFARPQTSSDAVFAGRFQRNGFSTEKYFIQGEGDYVIPFLLLVPDNPSERGLIYLHPQGKSAQASPGGELEWFVRQGYTVLAPDLVGTGELGPGRFRGDAYIGGVSYNQWFNSILIGRSIVGVQAGDVARLATYLLRQSRSKVDVVHAFARGNFCTVLLHAAAFDPSIQRLALVEPLISFRAVVMNRFYDPELVHSLVPAALTAYDLPDLAACLAPKRLWLINVTDQNRVKIDTKALAREFAFVRNTYVNHQKAGELRLVSWLEHQTIDDILSLWCR